MATFADIIRISEEIREHERHHIDGGCHAPSGGVCPKPGMRHALDRAWSELAKSEPAKYGWAEYRRRIATFLPTGKWEDEVPQIAWGQCETCGKIGPHFWIAGGKARCLDCLQAEAP